MQTWYDTLPYPAPIRQFELVNGLSNMTLHKTVQSPVFLVSLALLVVNDFYFKA